MDDKKILKLQKEIADCLKKEAEISKLLEVYIASLLKNLDKITTIKTK